MSILSGIKKVIPYFKNADGNYEQLSYKTSSQTVDFDDGKTAETKLGAIKGITTSTSVTETGYAADAKTVSEINQSLESLFKIVQIRINGEGELYSHINIDANYKLINIVGYYEGSDNGKYRVESFQQATDTTYILYLSDILSKDSYINAHCVLIHY